MWKLLIEDDAGKTIVVPMTRDEITIGRKEGNTIRLTERNVSRHHAKLLRNNGTVLIEDLESYNGIKLNGDKIKGRVEVKEGDLIEIGDYHLALQADGQHAGFEVPQDTTQLGGEPAGDDYDEFAGDTQRWESPVALDDGATVQDQAPLSFTAQAPPPAFTEEKTGKNTSAPKGAPAPITALGDPIPDPAGEETERAPVPSQDPAPPPLAAEAATAENPDSDGVRAAMARPDAAAAVRPAIEVGGAFTGAAQTQPMRVPGANNQAGQSGPTTSAGIPAKGSDDDDETEAMPPSPAATTKPETGPRFVALTTVFAGSVFPISRPEMVIGRVEDNEMVIEHRSVSRSHAKVFRDGDMCRIVDLQSANGILLNGVEVNEAVLQSGDIVELGRVQLRFVPAGESFTLSPAEVERARKADLAGDFNDDVGTVSRGGSFAPAGDSKNSVLLMGAGLIILLLVGVIVVLLMSGPEGEGDETPVAADDPVATDPPPEAPRNVVEEVKQLIGQGKFTDAINKANASKDDPDYGVAMPALILEAETAGFEAAKKRAHQALDDKDVDAARQALGDMRAFRSNEGADIAQRIDELEKAQQTPEDTDPVAVDDPPAEPEAPPEPEAVTEPDPDPVRAETNRRNRQKAVRAKRQKSQRNTKTTSKTKKTPPPDRPGERLPAPVPDKPDPAKGKELLFEATRSFIGGKCKKAESLARQAGKADPALKYEVYWFRGKCALNDGKPEDAKAAFRKYRSFGTVPAKKADANQELRKLGG